MIIVAVLVLLGIAILMWACLRAANTSSEADVQLHQVRRRLDVSLTRGEIKRDAMRLRRELDRELKELP